MATEALPSTRPQTHSVRIASLLLLAVVAGGGVVAYRYNHGAEPTHATAPAAAPPKTREAADTAARV